MQEKFGIEKIPSKPNMSRVLSIIDGEQVGKVIILIMKETVEQSGEVIAVDGKAIRSTSQPNHPHSALQIITAYLTENGVVLGQEKIHEKTSYYISDLDVSAKELLFLSREHWKIESVYWMLDVVFSEDNCSFLNENAHITLNSFRKLALLLHKQYLSSLSKSKKVSVKKSMLNCLLNDSTLFTLISCL